MPYCPSCGKEVFVGERFCPSCGVALPSLMRSRAEPGSVSSGLEPRTGYLAILLSFFFPGLGQYYLGDRRKGKFFIILGVAFGVALLIPYGVILYTLFWLFNMVDAFRTIRKAEDARPPAVSSALAPDPSHPF